MLGGQPRQLPGHRIVTLGFSKGWPLVRDSLKKLVNAPVLFPALCSISIDVLTITSPKSDTIGLETNHCFKTFTSGFMYMPDGQSIRTIG